MKLTPMILALISTPSVHAAPVQLAAACDNVIRASVAALEDPYDQPEDNGNLTIPKESLADVQISDVQVLDSQCLGPGDCDAQNPDAFTYSVTIGKKGEPLSGKIQAFYHRGYCHVMKINLE